MHTTLPSKGESISRNCLSQILWLGRVVRSNFLLELSELLTQLLNLIITMIEVITSSLQYLSHHNNAWPLLSGFPSMPPLQGSQITGSPSHLLRHPCRKRCGGTRSWPACLKPWVCCVNGSEGPRWVRAVDPRLPFLQKEQCPRNQQ